MRFEDAPLRILFRKIESCFDTDTLLKNNPSLNAKSIDNKALNELWKTTDDDLPRLLTMKSDVHGQRTLLHLACGFGHVRFLIKNGSSVTAQDYFKEQPLHRFACYRREKAALDTVLPLLLRYGADINARGQEGNSALHLAIWWSHSENFDALLERGADPNQLNDKGLNVLDFGAKNPRAANDLDKYRLRIGGVAKALPPPRKKFKPLTPDEAFGPGRFVTKTGSRVRSKTELLVANFLTFNGFKYEVDRRIPIFRGGDAMYFPDFYVPDVDLYIEVCGVMDEADYDVRMRNKVQRYQELKLRFVFLYPQHCTDNRELFDELGPCLRK